MSSSKRQVAPQCCCFRFLPCLGSSSPGGLVGNDCSFSTAAANDELYEEELADLTLSAGKRSLVYSNSLVSEVGTTKQWQVAGPIQRGASVSVHRSPGHYFEIRKETSAYGVRYASTVLVLSLLKLRIYKICSSS